MKYRVREHPKGVFRIQRQFMWLWWNTGTTERRQFESLEQAKQLAQLFVARRQEEKEHKKVNRIVWTGEV